jgi:hypothetical protein
MLPKLPKLPAIDLPPEPILSAAHDPVRAWIRLGAGVEEDQGPVAEGTACDHPAVLGLNIADSGKFGGGGSQSLG